ncbi:MAG: transposase [Verrucomicrobiaceae bacterium]
MQWLRNTCTRRHNVRHKKWGWLFGDRYKAVLVEAESGHYYQTLMDYIHLNPVRARLVRPRSGESVLDYPWSSVAGGYALPPRKRASWLATAAGLKAFRLEDTASGRRSMVERLDRRAVQEAAGKCGVVLPTAEEDARCSHLHRGWYWGSQAFADKVLALAEPPMQGKKARDYRSAAASKAHGLAQAEKWLREGLDAAGLDAATLGELKGTDPRKVALARLLWEHTTASQRWIAEQLGISSAANVSQLLKRTAKASSAAKLPGAFAAWLNCVKR